MWRVITLKSGFIYGDYAAQFYPWSMIYSEALKGGALPFWTRYFHSGFPLMAEGQVGGFYPLNLLFFAFFPFRAAYNYITVLHFALAGVFTYAYTRKMGACQWGGALAALIFCFGSAYAGCMVNVPTVKVLSLFPLVLWLFERYFESRRIGLMLAAGAVFGMQLLAGQTQVAVYSAIFYVVYFLYGAKLSGALKKEDLFKAILGVFVAAVIFMPQLVLTHTLAALSWRSEASIDFALSDSFSPLNFMSAVFPYPVFRGARFFIGILSLLFLIMAFFEMKGNKKVRPLFVILLVSFFLTLGKYNPLYVLFIKAMHLYGLRNPSKFLLFGLFAASVLAGWGFTRFFAPVWQSLRARAVRAYSWFIAAILVLFFAAKLILRFLGEQIISFGEVYATNNIYGKSFHRFDLETYIGKVHGFYADMVRSSSVLNPLVLVSIILCFVGFVLCRTLPKDIRKSAVYHKAVFFVLIFLDLLAFSVYGTGFRGNIMDYDRLRPQASAVYEAIKSDDGLFRFLPYDMASAKLPNWAMPSMNAVYALDSAALYTPLVNEYYRKALFDLEVVDNALGLKSPAPDSLDKNLELVKMLNVKYVISPYVLEKPFLEPVADSEGVYLYRVDGYLPRAFAVKDLMPDMIDPEVPVDVLIYGPGEAAFRLDIPYDGYLVFSENRYPGWEAYVDGERAEITPFSVIQAVKLTAGHHVVRFVYRPFGR